MVIAAIEHLIAVIDSTAVVRGAQWQRKDVGPVCSARTGAECCAAVIFYRIILSITRSWRRAHVRGAKLTTTAWVRVRMLARFGFAPVADLQIPAGNLNCTGRGLHGDRRGRNQMRAAQAV